MATRDRPRVLLVREWDTQASGSGCCGRLGGETSDVGDTATYAHTRRDMEAMGAVYRAIHEAFGDAVEITVVDPRNMIWLVPAMWGDARRRGLSLPERLRQLARGVGTGAVVCDGLVLFKGGEPPSPDVVVEALRMELAAA